MVDDATKGQFVYPRVTHEQGVIDGQDTEHCVAKALTSRGCVEEWQLTEFRLFQKHLLQTTS